MYINFFTWIIFFIIVYVIKRKIGAIRMIQFSQLNGKFPLQLWKQVNFPVIKIYDINWKHTQVVRRPIDSELWSLWISQRFMVLEGEEEVIKCRVRNRDHNSKESLKIFHWWLPLSMRHLLCGLTGSPLGNFQATQTQNFNNFHVYLYQDSVAKIFSTCKSTQGKFRKIIIHQRGEYNS